MSIELSNSASNTMLDALARQMDGGSLEFLDEQTNVLAALPLGSPSALPASDAELVFTDIGDDVASASGIIVSARVLGADGVEAFACDVGDGSSDAVIKLGTTLIAAGQPIRIDAFKLSL
jgi:hypothetical protein